jgi:hypothetical protein
MAINRLCLSNIHWSGFGNGGAAARVRESSPAENGAALESAVEFAAKPMDPIDTVRAWQ